MSKTFSRIGYATPIVIVAGLYVLYLTAPDFYLAYVLEETDREQGAVELITFGSALLGGILLGMASWRVGKSGNWPAASVLGAVAAASLFFAGEEVAWGQFYLGWETPFWWREHVGGSTDLHGSPFPVHTLAGIFLFVMFFLLPFTWRFQPPFRLSASLKPAIPEGPVIFTIAFATIYRELKGVYFWVHPPGYRDQFYEEFLWGLNEHKELLIAIAMLLYALYRLPFLKKIFPHYQKI